jgi:hypothetical protein
MDTETTESVEEASEESPLNMSDDAFLEKGDPVTEEISGEEEEALASDDEAAEQEEQTDEDDSDSSSSDDNLDNSSSVDDSSDDISSSNPHDSAGSEEVVEPVVEAEINYKAEYEKVMAPFKANGKEMNIKNIDDAIQLMQMGAGYNRKMAALKPNMAILKMLEKNELLSEEKLSFLIDINKKDPAAIAKLVKDAGIEPLEMDLEEDGYSPKSYAVNSTEIELDSVIEEIRNTSSFNSTIAHVDAWDTTSKQAVANDPNLLRVLNAQVDSGVYDLISTTVESERMYGRLQGLSDIQAYQTVGDSIHAKNGFDHLFEQGQQNQSAVKAEPKKGNDQGRKDKRRKASPTKQSAPTKAKSEYDPLAMSDEDFLKVGDSKFL